MHILFTGASSFTGSWFVKELCQQHAVTAIIQKPLSEYQGVRRARLEALQPFCRFIFTCKYGSDSFLKLVQDEPFDLFCHHAADVNDYKSPDFNSVQALANNTGPIQKILQAFQAKGCRKILLTGSIFEQGEGAGSEGLRAVSPYGLSKGLTSDFFRFYCDVMGFRLGKFVIPNPFGPQEEFRFTSFLAKSWFEKNPVHVSMPDYVRDNIHVSLLAKAYVKFAESLPAEPGFQKLNPSGYPESQGAFTERFAKEMRKRFAIPCHFTLADQQEFPEPKVRLNTDLLNGSALRWNEEKAWDELADYYRVQFGCHV